MNSHNHNTTNEPNEEKHVTERRWWYRVIIALLIGVLAGGGIVVWSAFENNQQAQNTSQNTQSVSEGQSSRSNDASQKESASSASNDSQNRESEITGYISAGKRQIGPRGEENVEVKLVQENLPVKKFRFSPANEKVFAYSTVESRTETIPQPERKSKKYSIETRNLHIGKKTTSSSDESSTIVKDIDQVYKWGWIPQTSTIWYEKEKTVSAFYSPFQTSRGTMYTFNVETNKRRTLGELGIGGGSPRQWSPNGEKLLFLSHGEGTRDSQPTAKLFDRKTQNVETLFPAPGIGLNRGGCMNCMALPSILEWNDDSSAFYMGFALQRGFDPHPPKKYSMQTGNVRLFTYSLQNEQLTPVMKEVKGEAPFTFSEEEQIAVYHKEGGLAMYDLNTKEEQTLVTEINFEAKNDGKKIWIEGEDIYVLHKPSEDAYMMSKFNTKTAEQTTVFKHSLSDVKAVKVWNNLHFLPQAEVLFFTDNNVPAKRARNKNAQGQNASLYRMDEKELVKLSGEVPTTYIVSAVRGSVIKGVVTYNVQDINRSR